MTILTAAEAAMADANRTGYDGWMIAETKFYFYHGFIDLREGNSFSAQCVRDSSRIACFRTDNGDVALEVTILKPTRIKSLERVEEAEITGREICKTVFGIQEIQEYIRNVRDFNPIHQGEHAVVPGYCMCNWLLEHVFLGGQAPFSLKFRFIQPLFCGEEMRILEREEGLFAGYCGSMKLFTAQKEML